MNPIYYHINENCTEQPTNDHYHLHNHDEYEILLFLEGDAKYIVEERTYSLEPCDIIVIRKHEMHRIYHNSMTRYRRVVLAVSPSFFQQNHCTEYEVQFSKAPKGTGNKISADIVRSCGLFDAFSRYKQYSENYALDVNSPILVSILIEILYLINKTSGFTSSDMTGTPMKSVLLYLNNRYAEDISLDMLGDKFYLSKYHLCRAFKKATGLTIHEYIRRKRLTRVRELRAEGKNITQAAMEAGFHDYSSFYRAYLKEHGNPPKSDLC